MCWVIFQSWQTTAMEQGSPTKSPERNRANDTNRPASLLPSGFASQFPTISNRKLKLLEPPLSPLISMKPPVIIANFEPYNCFLSAPERLPQKGAKGNPATLLIYGKQSCALLTKTPIATAQRAREACEKARKRGVFRASTPTRRGPSATKRGFGRMNAGTIRTTRKMTHP
jgi:hypothetical protein